MNWDRIEANWKQLEGQAKRRWGDLTDDDLLKIDGQRERLLGKLQERYGTRRDELEREIDDWGRKQARLLDASRKLDNGNLEN